MEVVQWRETKSILKSSDDYPSRLSKLNLQSLADPTYTRDVVFLYNIINEHYKIDFVDRLTFCSDRKVGYNLRTNDSLNLNYIRSRTNAFKYNYFTRIVKE